MEPYENHVGFTEFRYFFSVGDYGLKGFAYL